MKATGFFKTRLWRVLRWFGMVFAIVLLIFSIVSWIVVEKKNAWLLNEIQSYVNESQSGQLEIGSIDLKLFRNFPNVTLELDRVNYYEHRDSMRAQAEEPILHADQLFVAVELLPLIKEAINVSVINISNARLTIMEYQNGMLNIDKALSKPVTVIPAVIRNEVITNPAPLAAQRKEKITKPGSETPSGKRDTTVKSKPSPEPPPKSPPKPKATLQIDLNLISLHETLVSWKSYADPKPSVILVQELEVDLAKKENALVARLRSTYQVQSLYINHSTIPGGNLKVNADLIYQIDNQQLTIQKSKINYDIFSATISGTYAHQKNRMIDLQMDASSNDMQVLSLIIKPAIIKRNPNLLERGGIYVKGRIFGELKNQSPQWDISFGVKDLALRMPNKFGTFKNIGFEGKFLSGRLADYSDATFEIRNLSGQPPAGFFKGQFYLHNFVDPYVNYKLDAQLKLDGYDQIFQIDFLKALTGSISLQANFDGPLKYFGEHRMDSSRSSMITLNDLSFVVARTNQLVSGLSGKIENKNNQASLQQLTFHYGKNQLLLNATIENFAFLLLKQEHDITASGNLRAAEIFTRDFILDTLRTAEIQDRISRLSFDFNIKSSADTAVGKSRMPQIAFDIRNLSANFDKLPDIKMINTRGNFRQTDAGLTLNLDEFHAAMPQGKLDVTGNLLVRANSLWEFDAKLKADKFPWTYVNELIAEIKEGAEPHAKNLPLKEMEIVTADLDLTAAVITYPFDINKLDLRKSKVSYSYPGAKPMSVEQLNLSLHPLFFTHPQNSGELVGLTSMKGTMELAQLSLPGLNPIDIKMNITGAHDQLDVDFSSVTQKTRSEKGQLTLDISKKELEYHLNYVVKGASLDYFVQKYYKKKLMEGFIDYSLDMKTKGSTLTQAKNNISGEIEITGDSLLLYGMDVDDILKKYRKSQNFNLTDVGAVLIAGPVGLAVTKGSDFVSLAAINFKANQKTRIKSLLTKWKLDHLQLTTEDVAFSTHLNRIAFDGQIDFARDSIPGITISVVDKNGCSLMDQKLHGKMGKLQTGKLNVTKTLLGSVINFANAIVGKDCKPVYTGKVKDPTH